MEPVPVPSPRPWSIYVLCDPREADPVRRVRYVGCTTRPTKERRTADVGCPAKARWVTELREAGLMPVHETIETGDGDWHEAERRWIEHYRAQGSPLLNSRWGGFTKAGRWPPSPEYLPAMTRARRVLDVLLCDARQRAAKDIPAKKHAQPKPFFDWLYDHDHIEIRGGRLWSIYVKPWACWPVPLPRPHEIAAISAAAARVVPLKPGALMLYLAGRQTPRRAAEIEAVLSRFVGSPRAE